MGRFTKSTRRFVYGFVYGLVVFSLFVSDRLVDGDIVTIVSVLVLALAFSSPLGTLAETMIIDVRELCKKRKKRNLHQTKTKPITSDR